MKIIERKLTILEEEVSRKEKCRDAIFNIIISVKELDVYYKLWIEEGRVEYKNEIGNIIEKIIDFIGLLKEYNCYIYDEDRLNNILDKLYDLDYDIAGWYAEVILNYFYLYIQLDKCGGMMEYIEE